MSTSNEGLRNERHAHEKKGVLVNARLGEPSFPHIIAVSVNTYINRDGQMVLTEQQIEMVQALYGPPEQLIDRFLQLRSKAFSVSEAGLGSANFILDVTRSPAIWQYALERMPFEIFLCITTHGRLHDATPYWLIGRVTLLSHLATQIARGVLRFVPPPPGQPTWLTLDKVRDALVNARTKPPKIEGDEFLTNTTSDDDVGLVLAAAAMYSEQLAPDPRIELDGRTVRFADEPYLPGILSRP